MIIKNGLIFQENGTFEKGDVYIKNGVIEAVGLYKNVEESLELIIDATDMYVLPGLIDIHSHGAVGFDFSDGDMEGLEQILAYQHAHGVTSYCPTLMTLPKEDLLQVLNKFYDWYNHKLVNIPCINLEGPFLDPARKGSHRKEDILKPDVDFFRECNTACGNMIGLVTIAPNVDGAMDFIREVSKSENVVVSLGHTNADYDTAKEALQAGARHITHVFNAMSPMNHRNPGLIGVAAEEDNCMVELICDGVHVHESMVRAAFKLFPGRIVLISDSLRATGLGDGNYDLTGQKVIVRENMATLEDGAIAGSVTNLFDCMRKTIEFGISPWEAVAAATMNPAKSIGIFETKGSLTPGKSADVILVDKDWNLSRVISVPKKEDLRTEKFLDKEK